MASLSPSCTAFFHYDTTAYYQSGSSTAATGYMPYPARGTKLPRNDIWNQIDSLKEQIKFLQKEEIRFKNRTDIKLQLRNARHELKQLEAKSKSNKR